MKKILAHYDQFMIKMINYLYLNDIVFQVFLEKLK